MLRCTICATESQSTLCLACRSLLSKPQNGCPTCGKPLPHDDTTLCGECLASAPDFDAVIYASLYQYPIDHWVHQLKFGAHLAAAQVMAEALLPLLESIPHQVPLLAMPLHPSRLRQRGYNQAHEIARTIAQKQNRALLLDTLVRNKATQMQAALREKQRAANVRGAFSCPTNIPHRHVLLVDDVMTTGQTLRAAAKSLKKAGVQQVTAVVFARSKG